MRKTWRWILAAAAVLALGAAALGIEEATRDDAGDTTYQGLTTGEGNPIQVTTDAYGRLWVNTASGTGGVQTEDAAHTSGDKGVFSLGVIKATRAALASDGDYAGYQLTSNGDVRVRDDDLLSTHDSAASATGGQIMAAYDSTKPTAVADADAVRVLADSYGRLLAGLEPQWFNAVVTSADATGGATIKAATASLKIYILSIDISTDTAMTATIEDEDGNDLRVFYPAARGGVARTYPDSAPLVLNTANKALKVTASAAGNISVGITGYLAP